MKVSVTMILHAAAFICLSLPDSGLIISRFVVDEINVQVPPVCASLCRVQLYVIVIIVVICDGLLK